MATGDTTLVEEDWQIIAFERPDRRNGRSLRTRRYSAEWPNGLRCAEMKQQHRDQGRDGNDRFALAPAERGAKTMRLALALTCVALTGCVVTAGPVTVDIGNPWIDIGGAIFIVLGIRLGTGVNSHISPHDAPDMTRA